MSLRLADSTIWKKQRWFRGMPLPYKCAWKYLTDECNNAGIWKIDLSELLDDFGLDEFDFLDFLACCNKDFDKKTGKGMVRHRIIKFHEDYVWLTGFITFQYGGKSGVINESNNAIKSALKILHDFNLFDLAVEQQFISFEGKYTQNEASPLKPLEAPSTPFNPLQPPSPNSGKSSILPENKASPLKGVEAPKDKDKDRISNVDKSTLPENLREDFKEGSFEILIEDNPSKNSTENSTKIPSENSTKNSTKNFDENPEKIPEEKPPDLTDKKIGFDQRPRAENFNGLPEQYVSTAIRLCVQTGKGTITEATVTEMWEIFKVQHLTGEEFYPNAGKVYSHFTNWIKLQNFDKNGPSTTKFRKSGGKRSSPDIFDEP